MTSVLIEIVQGRFLFVPRAEDVTTAGKGFGMGYVALLVASIAKMHPTLSKGLLNGNPTWASEFATAIKDRQGDRRASRVWHWMGPAFSDLA